MTRAVAPGEPDWAFVWIDHVPFQAATALGEIAPDQAAGPVVLGGYPHERKAVIDCSPEAADRGIRPDQSRREAQAICPDAVFRPVDEAAVEALFDRLLIALAGFSPAFEPVGLGQVVIDIRGLSGLYGAGEDLARRLPDVVQSPASTVHSQAGGPRVGALGGCADARPESAGASATLDSGLWALNFAPRIGLADDLLRVHRQACRQAGSGCFVEAGQDAPRRARRCDESAGGRVPGSPGGESAMMATPSRNDDVTIAHRCGGSGSGLRQASRR